MQADRHLTLERSDDDKDRSKAQYLWQEGQTFSDDPKCVAGSRSYEGTKTNICVRNISFEKSQLFAEIPANLAQHKNSGSSPTAAAPDAVNFQASNKKEDSAAVSVKTVDNLALSAEHSSIQTDAAAKVKSGEIKDLVGDAKLKQADPRTEHR